MNIHHDRDLSSVEREILLVVNITCGSLPPSTDTAPAATVALSPAAGTASPVRMAPRAVRFTLANPACSFVATRQPLWSGRASTSDRSLTRGIAGSRLSVRGGGVGCVLDSKSMLCSQVFLGP